MKRLMAAVSSGLVGAALLVIVPPAVPAGAVTVGYNCGAGFAVKVKVTGNGLVNTLEEPTERFKAKNVVFTIFNPFSVAMTVNNVAVTVPDPATVSYIVGSGSTVGAGWVFTHPGISTDTHAAAIVVPTGGSFSSGAMKMKYRDVSTDPPGPGIVNWFGGNISFTVVSPAGIGAVTCTPISPTAFASVRDPV
jgi:hypothetical protein